MARIGFIGTGEIASAMVHGLALYDHQITVSDRNADTASALAQRYDCVKIADNQTVLDQSDIIILCLMEQTARTVLPSLSFRLGQRIISAMLGISLEELTTLCAPADDICITIPMPFIATGGCPLPVYPDRPALHELFGANNQIIPLKTEAAMNPHFAASALSSVIFAQLQAGTDWLADITGDAVAAESYVAALFAGYFRTMQLDGSGQFENLLTALSTEGGLNATLRQHMVDQGALDALQTGLDGFRTRLNIPNASET